MNADKRKNRTVYFSKIDPEEVMLLEHAEKINTLTGKKRNFSRYVKKLIAEDLKREQLGHTSFGMYTLTGNTIIDDDLSEDTKSDMLNFL